jgi:hypothetical protein
LVYKAISSGFILLFCDYKNVFPQPEICRKGVLARRIHPLIPSAPRQHQKP